MLDAPLTSDEVIIGCVTENNLKYLGQTLRLLQSIRWFGGSLAGARVVIGAVDEIDRRARRTLESFGAELHIVPRFHPRNGSANRLQLFPFLPPPAGRHFFMLDCDTIVVRDPLPLLKRGVFHAKIAPFPTVTHEVFRRLFAHFDVPLPSRAHVTPYTGTPTIPYFNAGVFCIAGELAERLVPEWRRFNEALAGRPELVAPCQQHLHQAALSLALATSGIPVAEAGAELNYQTNTTAYRAPAGWEAIDPSIIHYHDMVDADGMLLPSPFPLAQERLDAFNARLRDERARAMGTLRRASTPAASSARQIVVLGAPGSGLSLAATLIGAMGAVAGEDHELHAPDVLHPHGDMRRRDACALHDRIRVTDISGLRTGRRLRFAKSAAAIVGRMTTSSSTLIYEPRMAMLFPIWRNALTRPLCVLVWRDPSAVARSLARSSGLPMNVGLALWEEYTRAMLASTAGLPRLLVSYDTLAGNPNALLRDLIDAGAEDLRPPGKLDIPIQSSPANDDSEERLDQSQRTLLAALRDRSALTWETVAPPHPSTRATLAQYARSAAAAARAKQRRGRVRRAVSRIVRWLRVAAR